MSNVIKFQEWSGVLYRGRYDNDTTALRLIGDAGPIATVTLKVDDAIINDDEIIIKNHHENTGMLQSLLAADIVEPSTRSVPYGNIWAPVCKLKIDIEDIPKL